jgi:hypothetical protein
MHLPPLCAHLHLRFTERPLRRQSARADRRADVELQDLVPGIEHSIHQILIARGIVEVGPFTATVRRLLS